MSSLPARGPAREALPVSAIPLVVILGVTAMGAWMALAGPRLGVRGAIVGAQVLLCVPGLLLMGALRVPIRRSLGLASLPGRDSMLALLAGLGLWAAGLGLMQLQSALWPPPDEFLELFRKLHAALEPKGPLDEAFSVLAIALAPGLCEEVLFRGIVLPSLRVRLGTTAAVLGSALLFGAIHLDWTTGGPVWFRVPFAVGIGLGLGALRVRTGTLLAPMLAHAILNTITFEAVRFVAQPESSSQAEPVLGAVMLMAGIMGFSLAFRALAVAVPGGDRPV